MVESHIWHNEKLGLKVVEALKKNNFSAEYAKTKEDARQRLLELIPAGASVGLGGSVTVRQLNIIVELNKRGNQLFDHTEPNMSLEVKTKMRRKQLTSDIFLSSTNAVTLDGKLVNEDGTGNRVAAMIYGPQKVVIVVGINKIVKNVDSALDRLEMYTTPMNNYRLRYPNPCAKTGFCIDCDSESRICNVITIMRKKPSQTDITVIIIGEVLGL